MRGSSVALWCAAAVACAGTAWAEGEGIRGFAPERVAAQRTIEEMLIGSVRRDRLRSFHEGLSNEPSPAGTEADLRKIRWLSKSFGEMGLEVEEHWIDVYLARPVTGEVEIVRDGTGEVSVGLSVQEGPIPGDAYVADEGMDIGWSAYSGSGEVVAGVVYANYGRRQDFEALREMGVDVRGKIVIARFGGNYRGYKAKFAEEHGAAGLIMYTDPKDSGYVRGLMYPDGGWATPEYIERGSVKTLDYVGDPLTPGVAATVGAEVERLDPEELALPRIPVQPIGWGAAQEILSRMEGRVVPEAWQGGLPLNYRVDGGEALRVRLKVEQDRRIMRTANVVAILPGAKHPDEWVIVGSHHDAWTHGAGDPNAGTMIVLELARMFSERVRSGQPVQRSMLFACWGVEEYGIIGSTEWVEEHAEHLGAHAVAYLNLDMAAMGLNFRASASPSLRTLILEASKVVASAVDPDRTVYEVWSEQSGGTPGVRVLGGGSDHVPFLMHAGIPSMAMSGGGSSGVSYHSAYDNLHWYWKVVGDDYKPAEMIARVAAVALSRLANADVVPLETGAYADVVREQLGSLAKMAEERGLSLDPEALSGVLDELRSAHTELFAHEINDEVVMTPALIGAERAWVEGPEPTKRPWYRNRFIASDWDSGYASWVLPQLRGAIESENQTLLDEELNELRTVLERMTRVLREAASE